MKQQEEMAKKAPTDWKGQKENKIKKKNKRDTQCV